MIGISFDDREKNAKKEANRVLIVMILLLGLTAVSLILMFKSAQTMVMEIGEQAYSSINYVYSRSIDLLKPSAIAFSSMLAGVFLLALKYTNGRWKYLQISGSILTILTITIFIVNATYAIITFPMLLINSNLSFFALLGYIARLEF